MKTLASRLTTISNETFKIDIRIKGGGQNPKLLCYVNNQEWFSVNSCNFIRDEEFEFNFINEELKNGAFKMFKNN